MFSAVRVMDYYGEGAKLMVMFKCAAVNIMVFYRLGCS